DRDRRHRADVHQPRQHADRGLHLRPLRLIPRSRGERIAPPAAVASDHGLMPAPRYRSSGRSAPGGGGAHLRACCAPRPPPPLRHPPPRRRPPPPASAAAAPAARPDVAVAPVLRARRLAKTYGEQSTAPRAPDGVDLDTARADSLATMGPAGCGKTALLHVLAGILQPSSGAVD